MWRVGFNGGERGVVEEMDGPDSSRDVEVCVSAGWGWEWGVDRRVMVVVKKVLGLGSTALVA